MRSTDLYVVPLRSERYYASSNISKEFYNNSACLNNIFS